MFKRLVSNLPYSPALIGQVGFYAQRLRKEEATRRLGLVFTALALVVQSLAVFNPPEAQAIASPQNVIFEGVKNKKDLLRVYDANVDRAGHTDIKKIFTYFGIDREDLATGHVGTFNSRDFNGNLWSVGRNSYDAGTQYEQTHKVDGSDTTVYARKLWRFDSLPYTIKNGSTYKGLIGHRDDGSWFAVSFDCGNIAYTTIPEPPPAPKAACSSLTVTPLTRTNHRFVAKSNLRHGATAQQYDFVVKNNDRKTIAEKTVASSTTKASTKLTIPEDGDYIARVVVQTNQGAKTSRNCVKPFTVSPEPRCPLNPELTESNPDCKPCPGDNTVWHKDKTCDSQFVAGKTVANNTQSLDDATNSTAKAGDRMTYTLSVKNTGLDSGTYTIRDNLSDVMEYADVLEVDGGTMEKNSDGEATGYVSWPEASLAPGATVSKTITVQVKDSIPATPQNEGNPESYNCIMTNSYGTSTNVQVECPPAKTVEQTVQQLPATGTSENIWFGGILFALVTYFYARARQLKKEVRLLRRDFASGNM